MDLMLIMDRNNMKRFQLGLYEKALPNEWSWDQKLNASQQAGYDFLEISIDESDFRLSRLNNEQELLNIQQAISQSNQPIYTMCLSAHRKYPLGSQDAKIVERSLQILVDAVDLASKIGVRIIQLAGYDVYYEESTVATKERFGQNLKEVVEIAASKGIILAFETMETSFMDTVSKAVHYVHEIDSPYLQIYPDIGNLTNAAKLYNHNIFQDLIAGKGHIVAVHLKETIMNHYREIPFGTGHVNFEQCIQTSWDLGVRMYTAEFWYDPKSDALQVCKENYDFIMNKFNSLK